MINLKSYGGGVKHKKSSCKGKLSEKKLCAANSQEKKFMHTEKKYSCKGNVNEKTFVQLENTPPPPPITFLVVRP